MTIEIFEKHPTADAYKVGAAFTEYCILAKEKRFSDAELAAEHWSWQGNVQWWLRPERGHGSGWCSVKPTMAGVRSRLAADKQAAIETEWIGDNQCVEDRMFLLKLIEEKQ